MLVVDEPTYAREVSREAEVLDVVGQRSRPAGTMERVAGHGGTAPQAPAEPP
ncbi:hypothetical protein ACH4ZX_14555 [Streptomyces sp. NPDC020490]|uniref:hypothetical protein n=1 Tax=Streptomyces sp. NPDC020490 TaxID=3365078 RepID=UPI00378A9C0E